MVNFTDLFLFLFCGFAVSWALAGVAMPVYETCRDRFNEGEGNVAMLPVLSWMAALCCGPALLADRLLAFGRSHEASAGDLVLGWFVFSGWCALYGYVLLGLAQRV